MWYVFSMCLSFFNKTLLGERNFHFPSPMFITGIQARDFFACLCLPVRAELSLPQSGVNYSLHTRCAVAAASATCFRLRNSAPLSWPGLTVWPECPRPSIRVSVCPSIRTTQQFGVQYLICLGIFRLFPSIAPPAPPPDPAATSTAAAAAAAAAAARGPSGLTPREFWARKILPVGIAIGADIALSNLSLVHITITLYTMCKSTAPVFVLIFAIIFGLARTTLDYRPFLRLTHEALNLEFRKLI